MEASHEVHLDYSQCRSLVTELREKEIARRLGPVGELGVKDFVVDDNVVAFHEATEILSSPMCEIL